MKTRMDFIITKIPTANDILLMSATIKAERPDEKTIAWFVKNVGPRTHYLRDSIGGKGWKFHVKYESMPGWYLTVDDERHLTYYLLIK